MRIREDKRRKTCRLLQRNRFPSHTRTRTDPRSENVKLSGKPRAEQAMKNWEGKNFIFEAAVTIPVYPRLLGAHALFCPPVEAMHAVTMSLKVIGLQCVDQQTDSLVFTEFQSDHRE